MLFAYKIFLSCSLKSFNVDNFLQEPDSNFYMIFLLFPMFNLQQHVNAIYNFVVDQILFVFFFYFSFERKLTMCGHAEKWNFFSLVNDGKIYCLFVLFMHFYFFFCRSMNRGKEIWWMNKSLTQCIVKRVVTGINFSIFMISLKCDKVLENVNFSFFHFTMIFILNSIFFWWITYMKCWHSYIFIFFIFFAISRIHVQYVKRYKFHSNRQSGHFNAIFFAFSFKLNISISLKR